MGALTVSVLLLAIAAPLATATPLAATPLAAAAPPQSVAERLDAVHREMVTHFNRVVELSGDAVTIETRIDSDLSSIDQAFKPKVLTQDEFDQYASELTTLDASLIDQLSTGKFHAIADVRGADEIFVRSPYDHSLQPAALYVPTTYNPAKPSPLVLFLHGKFWTEIDYMAMPFFRQLAESTGAIVVAPYARGDIQYVDPAPADVYATLDAVVGALNIDKKRVYLAGHSMGGFGVFEVGPQQANRFAGFLCASGSMTDVDRDAVLQKFRDKPVYVVSGTLDDNIPNSYSVLTVQYLRDAGIPVQYYPQWGAGHNIKVVFPAFTAAWRAMLEGTRPSPGMMLPGAAPPGSQLPTGPS
ncbi:MAG TPA: alpha/beta fold hydrolase [Candidatus Eremiobacteraceae bacterium]|jgi:predicted esterase